MASKQGRYKSDQGPSVMNHSAVKVEAVRKEEEEEEEKEEVAPRAKAAVCFCLAGLLLTSYCGHFYVSRRHDGGSQVRSCASAGAARSRLRRAGYLQQRGGRRGVDDGELAGKEQNIKNKQPRSWVFCLRCFCFVLGFSVQPQIGNGRSNQCLNEEIEIFIANITNTSVKK